MKDIETSSAEAKPGRRPNPRWDQYRRTLYLLRRNGLAMVGVVLLLFFVAMLVGSFFVSASHIELQTYCGTFYDGQENFAPLPGCKQVCTYPVGQPSPSANCYPTDPNNPSFVGPTVSLHPLQLGPLPLGSLTPNPVDPQFFNIFDGELIGTQWDLAIAFSIVLAGVAVGLLLGSVAGLLGGYVDETIMRITDVFLSVPQILLVLVLLIIFAASVTSVSGRVEILVLGFAVTWWPFYTRIIRSQVIVVREQKYVEAARASGASTAHIVRRHIIPNSLYPVFVQMALDVGTIPLAIGTIAFLGFTIFPNAVTFPEWGTMAALSVAGDGAGTGAQAILTSCSIAACYFPWWQFLFPGLVLFLFAIAVNFVSDGLRDALDPRLRR